MIQTILIRIGLAAVVFALGAWLGYSYERNDRKADQAEAQTETIEIHDQAAEAGRVVERAAVQRNVKTDAVFNGIQRGVIAYAQSHPAAIDCRLDDDGLRLWRAANAGTDPDRAGSIDGAVRTAPATEERSNDGTADQPQRSGAFLPPVPQSAPGTDRLAGGND